MRVSALKRVDLPTFGNPTIPALNISADASAREPVSQLTQIVSGCHADIGR